jgi:hypothetical protein
MGLLDALRDPQFRRDLKTNAGQLAQSMSNTAASTVTAPVDAISWLLSKGGLDIKNPVGGSDWAKLKGLTQDVPEGLPKVAGETLGLLAPLMGTKEGAAATARTLRQLGENAAKPRTMNPETGAIVWHGSPHKFDKFDSSKIGTGEGAQAYGHGLYLAESPDVAKTYRDVLSDVDIRIDGKPYNADDVIHRATYMVNEQSGNVAKAIEKLQEQAKSLHSRGKDWSMSAAQEKLAQVKYLRSANKLPKYEETPLGSLYKVDLPDEHIAKMLDWDKPLSQQAPEVQAIFGKSDRITGAQALKSIEANPQQYFSQIMTGKDLTGAMIRPERGSSEFLKQKGIPGIRYLDGGSRGAGQGTSNYVVFPGNEGLLKILERNGIPMGANAAAPRTMNPQAGMALFNLDGLPNQGKELIQTKANDLASQLKNMGMQAEVTHSGSKAGPSSYIKVFDPETGRFFTQDIRLSGHSKGAFNNQAVWDVNESQFPKVLELAQKMRDMGAAPGYSLPKVFPSEYIPDVYAKSRPLVAKALQEAKNSREFSKAFSNSGKYIGKP